LIVMLDPEAAENSKSKGPDNGKRCDAMNFARKTWE
jgi:hypothetical protein